MAMRRPMPAQDKCAGMTHGDRVIFTLPGAPARILLYGSI
jgi:hypothetical protein